MTDVVAVLLLLSLLVLSVWAVLSALAWWLRRQARRRPHLTLAPDVWDGSERESERGRGP